jgi:hypothetical protein
MHFIKMLTNHYGSTYYFKFPPGTACIEHNF